MSTHELMLAGPEATQRFAAGLARILRRGDLLILTGGLGAGKTTFTQGLAAGLGVRGRVTSPTFIVAREHRPGADGPGLVHVDAYRLGDAEELDDLDPDAWLEDSVVVVEWGEGRAEQLSDSRLEIVLEPQGHGATVNAEEDDTRPRRARVRAIGPAWEQRAPALATLLDS